MQTETLRERFCSSAFSRALGFLCQMMEASLYDKIMDQQRLEPEFFRVGFYGKKFPFFLRVKTFQHALCFMNFKQNYTFSHSKEEKKDLQKN